MGELKHFRSFKEKHAIKRREKLLLDKNLNYGNFFKLIKSPTGVQRALSREQSSKSSLRPININIQNININTLNIYGSSSQKNLLPILFKNNQRENIKVSNINYFSKPPTRGNSLEKNNSQPFRESKPKKIRRIDISKIKTKIPIQNIIQNDENAKIETIRSTNKRIDNDDSFYNEVKDLFSNVKVEDEKAESNHVINGSSNEIEKKKVSKLFGLKNKQRPETSYGGVLDRNSNVQKAFLSGKFKTSKQ